jgi:hypothetical protein
MDVVLYETTMQVVPLLLIALFLDRRPSRTEGTAGSHTYERVQNRIFLVLGLAGFMFLLCTQIWRRFNRQAPRPAGRQAGSVPTVPTIDEQAPSS